MAHKILIFGLGYVGTHLAKELFDQGWQVFGTCRDEVKKAELEELGFHVALFDGTKKIDNWENFCASTTHVLQSIPPIHGIDPVYTHHKEDLEKLNLKWFGYLSTTGVYGDYKGEWVTEKSALYATSPRALARITAEKSWHDSAVPLHVFRLGGIYGPGRSAIENASQIEARNIYSPNHYFSRIHVADIVATLKASMHTSKAGQVYNVVDDLPTPSYEVTEFAAEILGLPVPPRVAPEDVILSAMAQEFYANNKRVKNDKIKNDLGIELTYPTYRVGLWSMLE